MVIDFRAKHSGETAVILGNGPSLAHDIEYAKIARGRGMKVFGTNRVYLSGFVPDYYVCVNPLVLDQFADEIAALRTIKFLPRRLEGDVHLINTSMRYPHFQAMLGAPMWEGHTVTYVALQIAYGMGFKRVILLGVDHNYGREIEAPNAEVQSWGDTGHFVDNYFPVGSSWNLPDLAASEMAYSLAAGAYAAAGKEIINATHRTALRAFPLSPARVVFGSDVPDVSAIVSAYYADEFLQGRLEDLDMQVGVKVQAIVVCQEDSAEDRIASAFEPMNMRMDVIRTVDVPTVYGAWNLGIESADAPFITNANSDDRLNPNAFRIMSDILRGRPDIDLVYGWCYISWGVKGFFEFVGENPQDALVPGRVPEKPGYFTWPPHDRSLLVRGCYIGPQPMWRATLHQRFGTFQDLFQSAGDWDFWLRVAGESNFLLIPAFLGVYTARPGGLELSDHDRAVREDWACLDEAQTKGFVIEPMIEFQDGQELVRVIVGDRFSITTPEALGEAVKRLEANA